MLFLFLPNRLNLKTNSSDIWIIVCFLPFIAQNTCSKICSSGIIFTESGLVVLFLYLIVLFLDMNKLFLDFILPYLRFKGILSEKENIKYDFRKFKVQFKKR